jgi:hypothetical protein
MIFWSLLGGSVLSSWILTRGRDVDAWSRVFWGCLVGIGLWLVWLCVLPLRDL